MRNLKKLLLSCYVFLCAGTLLTWMHQDSLETFWQQSYHRPPPWQPLHTFPAWQAGSRVHAATAKALESFWLELSGPSEGMAVAAGLAINTPIDTGCQCRVAMDNKDSLSAQLPAEVSVPPVAAFKPHAKIRAGQRIFFAGDSMMQGVAPHLAARLRREYGVSSVDLSRQSTGLAYPSSFNWPATIVQTLDQHPDIKVLAIFLGPNDPWDMPSGKGGKYLRYASAEWEALYRSRIRDIISTAQSRNVDLIWISSPNMRRKKLSEQVAYLNGLYESEVLQAGEVFLSANQVLQYPEATYSDYMGDGSLKQKMRSGDGIHFTLAGQRTLADALFDRITFIPEQQAQHDTAPTAHTLN